MQNTIKKTILIITIIILIIGGFLGYKFYKISQNGSSNLGLFNNTNKNRTPFQTRVSTTTNIFDTKQEDNSVENPTTTEKTKQRLVELWKEPVSGFDFVYKDIDISVTSTTTENQSTSTIQIIKNKKNILKNQEFIYLWDRKTGNIYENISSTTEINKLSYFTFIGAEEVDFIDDSSVLIKKVDDDNETINTQYVKLTKESSTSTLYNGTPKDINIDSTTSFSKETKRIFYFIKNTGRGILSTLDGSTRTNIINTSLTEWLHQYVNKNIISLTTKPSAYFPGYLFFLNPDGKSKNTYIIGEKYGFNVLVSPDGKKIIYNEIINNTLETFIYDIKSKTNTYLSQATIVDKCSWTNDSKLIYCGIPQKLYEAPYPDAWYKNNIEFSDNIWSINPETGDFNIIIPLQDMVINPIDVYKIKISNTNKYILFQDKNTLNLWKYEI